MIIYRAYKWRKSPFIPDSKHELDWHRYDIETTSPTSDRYRTDATPTRLSGITHFMISQSRMYRSYIVYYYRHDVYERVAFLNIVSEDVAAESNMGQYNRHIMYIHVTGSRDSRLCIRLCIQYIYIYIYIYITCHTIYRSRYSACICHYSAL